MEALRIISESWPIAAMAIAMFTSVGVNTIVRRVTAREDERVLEHRISSRVQLELKRIGQMKTVDDNG